MFVTSAKVANEQIPGRFKALKRFILQYYLATKYVPKHSVEAMY